MSEIDLETRIELLLANYAAMISQLMKIENKLNELESWVKTWN